MKRTPAARDPEAVPVTPAHRFDFDAEGALEAIQPTLDALARISDRVARTKAQRDEPAADDGKAA